MRRVTATHAPAWGLIAANIAIAPALADAPPQDAIVKLEPAASLAEILVDYETTLLGEISAHRVYLLDVPDGWNEDAFELALETDVRIETAELNYGADAPGGHTQSFYLGVMPAEFLGQYLWDRVGLGAAHATTGGQGVTIALLDTGVDASHLALAGVGLLGGIDFVDQDADPDDAPDGADTDGDGLTDELVGHGTFLAGLLATVAPDASILPVRVLDADGTGHVFRLIQGIYYAADEGARVINMSLGTVIESAALEQAVEYARANGAVLIAAVGNEGVEDPSLYPYATSNVFGIASTDVADHKSPFSSYGAGVDLCAPGSDVVSIVPDNGYGRADGTSTSTAIVSACAALVIAHEPTLGPEEIEAALAAGAVDIDPINPGFAGLLGAGLIDAAGALAAVQSGEPVPADLDENGSVGMSDLLILIAQWGQPDSAADLNDDGVVNFADIMILIANWG
ncbi:MAG: S8 family serine peptidase [Planctomycetes bacterium]|nr:S8 family serine peptidase [Planctomycetota bacterium]